MTPEEQKPVEIVDSRDYTKEQNDRCFKTSEDILKIFIEVGLPEDMLRTKGEKDDIYIRLLNRVHPMLMANGVDSDKDITRISEMLGSSLYVLIESVKESLKRNETNLRNALFGLEDDTNEVVTVKMISDMVVRRQKVREMSSEVLKTEL